MDWYEARDQYWKEAQALISSQQKLAVEAVDATITRFSTPENSQLFCEAEALARDPRWEEIRSLAKEVCRVFGWTLETPNKSNAVYIRGG